MDFRLDTRELKSLITPRTKLIILNSPQNPTGGVMTQQDVEEVAAIVAERDIMVLSDEIYSRLIFDGDHHSLFSYDDLRDQRHSAGWLQQDLRHDRVAHGIRRDARRPGATDRAPDDQFELLHRQLHAESGDRSHPRAAGVGSGDERRIQESAATILPGASTASSGFHCRVPKGAFYMFPNIAGTGWKSKPLADALLEEAGVAVLSGTAFGSYGEGYLRFSIANSLDNIRNALDRVEAWVGKNVEKNVGKNVAKSVAGNP